MKVLLLLTCAAVTTVGLAQKSTDKKVDTRFINVPNYDLSSTDVQTLQPSFATGYSTYGAKKLMDTKSTCVVKGGSLKDAKELTTYYYQHEVKRPAAYMFLKDQSGNTVYASQISTNLSDKADFGKGKCEFWMKSNLEKTYEAERASWERSDHSTYVGALKGRADRELSMNGLTAYVPIEIEVYSAKGKGFDYAALDEAFDLAYGAYEDINDNGLTQKSFDNLGKAISIWTKELESADMEDKDARINKKIAQGLYFNLAYAHFMRFEMSEAAIFAQKADESYGNFTGNKRVEMQEFRSDVNRRRGGVEKNSALIKDLAKMNELAKQSTSIKLVMGDYLGSLEDARTDYYKFAGEEQSIIAAASEEANLEAGGTSYDKYVVPNSVPMTLSIMKFQEQLTELPVSITQIEGLASIAINSNDIETIPAEIGNMSSLKKLWLANNKIKELPEEIGNCSSLNNLNLSGNPIERLPESIKNCSDLKKLNLKGTNVSPEHLAELESWLPNCKIKV